MQIVLRATKMREGKINCEETENKGLRAQIQGTKALEENLKVQGKVKEKNLCRSC